MNYKTPGVYVNETPLTSLTTASSGEAAACFLGEAVQGPTTPQLVSNWTSYKALYGEITTKYDLPYAVYHYFANGGRQVYVIRTVSATAQTASLPDQPGFTYVPSASDVVPPTPPATVAGNADGPTEDAGTDFGKVVIVKVGETDWLWECVMVELDQAVGTDAGPDNAGTTDGETVRCVDNGGSVDHGVWTWNATDSRWDKDDAYAPSGEWVSKGEYVGGPDVPVTDVPFTADALSAGAWGNGLSLELTPGSMEATPGSRATFNLVVSLNGKEVERWNDLSLDPNGNRYVDSIVNIYSKFIVVSEISEAEYDSGEYFPPSQVLTLTDGSDRGTNPDSGEPYEVTSSDYNDALRQMDGVKGNLLINVVGKSDPQIVGNTVSYAAERGDSFVVIDPARDAKTVSDLTTTASRLASISATGYAAHYAPMLKMVDPARTGPGAIRTTFPGGAVCGVITRTENERNIAKAPAGISAGIRGALAMEIKISEADMGVLYDNKPHVNSFKVIPGAGINIYGSRTLARTTPDKYIPVRRTLNYIKSSVKDLTQFAVFEPNGPRLWNQVSARTAGFLAEMWRNGSLAGSSSQEAFYVVCDDTNNTQLSVDNGIVNVDVGVALSYPAEFVVINISQWTGGANAVDSL